MAGIDKPRIHIILLVHYRQVELRQKADHEILTKKRGAKTILNHK
jgi:hypothetical protein